MNVDMTKAIEAFVPLKITEMIGLEHGREHIMATQLRTIAPQHGGTI